MHAPGILNIVLILLLCVLTAGCTSDGDGGLLATPTMVPSPTTVIITMHVTQPPATTVVTPSTVPSPEPVQVLPAERQANLVLTKDRPTSEIHLLFQGGLGEIFVTRVMMRV